MTRSTLAWSLWRDRSMSMKKSNLVSTLWRGNSRGKLRIIRNKLRPCKGKTPNSGIKWGEWWAGIFWSWSRNDIRLIFVTSLKKARFLKVDSLLFDIRVFGTFYSIIRLQHSITFFSLEYHHKFYISLQIESLSLK